MDRCFSCKFHTRMAIDGPIGCIHLIRLATNRGRNIPVDSVCCLGGPVNDGLREHLKFNPKSWFVAKTG